MHMLVNGEKTEMVAGCMLEGSRGHYIARDFVEIAIGLGFWVSDDSQKILDAYPDDVDGVDPETIQWISDDAESWFQNRLVDGILVFNDGVYLFETEHCSECGELRFVDADVEDRDCSEHLPIW